MLRAMARPEHQPTEDSRRVAELAAGCGIPEDDIAVIIGVTGKTLRKHYRAELDRGMAVINFKIVKNLARIAQGQGREAVTAAIYWTKTRMGWSEFAPAPSRLAKPGKKELEQEIGINAGAGTQWGDLVDEDTVN